MTELRIATSKEDIIIISKLAKTIFNEHYISMMSQEQVNHMIDTTQSVNVITNQIADNIYIYYLIIYNGKECGYVAFKLQDKDTFFISKLYILSDYRGKGLASYAIDFCTKKAEEYGCTRMWLICNQLNTHPVEVYRHKGFKEYKKVVTDFGKGFTCNDFYMQKFINDVKENSYD